VKYSQVLSQHLHGDTEKNHDKPVSIVINTAGILTVYVPNTNPVS